MNFARRSRNVISWVSCSWVLLGCAALAGWSGSRFGLVVFAAANAVLCAVFVWLNARSLRKIVHEREALDRDAQRVSEDLLRTNTELKVTEERLQTVIENLSEGLIVSTLDGQLLHWNRAALEMHGFASADEWRRRLPEFVGLFQLSSLNGVPLQMDQWPLPRIFREGRLKNFEVHIRRLDEDWNRLFCYGGAVVNSANGDRLAFVTITDITERKRAEQELRESEDRYRHLIDDARDAVFTLGADQTITSLNPAFEAITGFSRSEWLGKTFAPLVRPEALTKAFELFQRTLQGEKPAPFEVGIRRKSGGFAEVELSATAQIANGVSIGLLGIGRDITERKQLESRLRQSQKMESLGTLAGGIAHDFNNLLAAIGGYNDLAKMATKDPAVAQHLDAIETATSRATELVKQILAFSRRQEPRRRPILLREVIEESLRLLRAMMPSTIEISATFSAPPTTIEADPTQIHQIIMNLGTNATHAMSARVGKFEIKEDVIDIQTPVFGSNSGLSVGRYSHVSISDTGTGMDRQTLSRIFEPFFTTKAPGEGTGLGLSVVHGIMQSHQGSVTVYSQPGEGTVVHLYFPVRDGEPDDSEKSNPVQFGRGQRILFVDDEVSLAQMGEKLLSRLGYVVESTHEAPEALARFRSEPEKHDLVITDLTMPTMTGVDFARQIHAIRPDLPIILITGHNGNLEIDFARKFGICEILIKPQPLDVLAASVHRALSATKKGNDEDNSPSR